VTTYERSRLGLPLAISHMSVVELRGCLSLVGKVYKTLEGVKTKYLAVSPLWTTMSN
jgi:hypothetical protein